MATSQQLARQFQRELDAKKEALARLRERTQVAEDREYASSTVYGNAFIRSGLNAIISEITNKLARITSGWATANAAAVAVVKDMDPAVLALITAKAVLDSAGRSKKGKGWNADQVTYVAVTTRIGNLVRDEAVVSHFAKENPAAYELTTKFHGAHKGYRNKVASYRAAMRRAQVDIPAWTPGQRHQVGAWLFDRLVSATGWFTVEARTTSRPNSPPRMTNGVYPTPEFIKAQQTLMDQAEAMAVCLWPMLCEPNDWTEEHRGGYLTSELRQSLILGGGRRGCTVARNGSAALRMLNILQKVPYKINPYIITLANTMAEKKITVGSFKQLEPIQPPIKPDWDTATDEEKKQYRIARTEIEDFNVTISSQNWRTSECLFVANKYKDEEAFWVPWSFDFRGRVYPQVTTPSPQGTDFEKALLLFAEEGPVNRHWLAFQVATTYGLDKASMDDRQIWVNNNHDLISRIATDPLGSLQEWSQAEEPWCFLAACFEYYDCVIEQTRSISGLPVSVDATCSGLQHLSALTLDRSAAEMVNVVPTPKPTDAYACVAEAAKKYLPEVYHALMNRKVTKRTVMTTPYGVTISSARGYIRQELPKTLPDGSPVELGLVTKAVFQQAIPEVIPGPIKAMGWIQRAALEHIKQGNDTISWTTPSGFTVHQDCRKNDCERINTKLLGCRVVTSVAKPWAEQEVDRQRHRGSSAPNLIHSLDASLLHLAFADFQLPFTLIHDCILLRSCDMDWVNTRIRQVFVEMYSQPILRNWANELGVQFDESVMLGTLDINEANSSPYLFC